jgi:uncharacterized protein YrrD
MLIKALDIVDRKIMTLKTGEFVEKVKDIIYDPQTNEVLALLISDGGWFSDAKVIHYKDIHSIGEDAIVVENKEVIREAKEIQGRVNEIARKDTYLTATRIVTEQGEELGKVTDIFFDEQTGKVVEFQVSGGAVQDVREGKKRVRISDILTVGKDATIVKSYTVESFEAQGETGGLQGAARDMKEQAEEAIDRVRDGVEKTTQKARLKAEEMQNDPENKQRAEGIKNKLSAMRDAAGEDIRKIQESLPGQAEKVKDDLGTKTRKLGEDVKGKVGDLQEESRDRLLADTAGQVLNKTVFHPVTNEVIGTFGDVVDYDMLERAREAGVLDQITNNVQKPLE